MTAWVARFADLRISITDRCNFRCPYCMPKEIFGPGYEFLPRSAILSFEEIVRLASIFGRMGPAQAASDRRRADGASRVADAGADAARGVAGGRSGADDQRDRGWRRWPMS